MVTRLAHGAGIDHERSPDPGHHLLVGVSDDHDVGVDVGDPLEFGRLRQDVLGVRGARAGVGHQQPLGADGQLDARGLLGEPRHERRVDTLRRSGPRPVRSEEADVVIAEHAPSTTVTQQRDRFVAEAELLDHITGAQQFVDIAHALQCCRQSGGIAVDVGDDADAHQCAPSPDPGLTGQATERTVDVTIRRAQ